MNNRSPILDILYFGDINEYARAKKQNIKINCSRDWMKRYGLYSWNCWIDDWPISLWFIGF